MIGVAGSVAVGKSTFARVLQALLSRWPDHPKVDLVTTDGFLHPNAVLEERGIMNRKGFPESYDTRRLLAFLREVKSGEPEVRAPVYSHVVYDIVAGPGAGGAPARHPHPRGPQRAPGRRPAQEFVSDYFDFSIYIDAEEPDIEQWYVERFLKLRETVFQDPRVLLPPLRHLSDRRCRRHGPRASGGRSTARTCSENILPTRSRAALVLHKADDHRVTSVKLRKL